MVECALAGGVYHASGVCNAQSLCVEKVPTVSEWGLIVLTLLGMTMGTIFLVRHHAASGG